MSAQQDPREAPPRALEGGVALASPRRGRSAAPLFSIWLPIATKVAAAALGALVLAVIGAKAGAHGPPPPFEPAPSAAPSVVAAAFMVGIPSAPTAGDAGPADLPAPPPATAAPRAGPGLLADGRVVLNAASETELTKLAGIGPSRARAILALRQRMTRFRAVEDLLRIKGIGRKMLRRLRPNVVLDPPPIDPQATHDPSAVASPEAEVSDRADR